MTAAQAYVLVGVSSVTHAWWNYLLKRAGGGELFVALSKACEVVLLLPAFLWFAAPGWPSHAQAWPLVLGGATLVMANYLALSRAYHHGDLSVVYPISRGAILIFLPAIGLAVFGERLSPVGVSALALIILGCALLPFRRFSLRAGEGAVAPVRGPAVAYALIAALAAASYTAWDKAAVGRMPALVYFYAYTVVTAVAFLFLTVRRHDRETIQATWREHWWSIIRVGALNSLSYLLVLVALREGTSSYVIALRHLSILWSVLLGHLLLRETIAPPQRLGLALLLAGCALVGFAT